MNQWPYILLSREKVEEFHQQKIEEWPNQNAPVTEIQKTRVKLIHCKVKRFKNMVNLKTIENILNGSF